MRRLVFCVTVLTLAGAATAGEDGIKKDQKKLQGTWKLVGGTDEEGKKFAPELLEKGVQLVITGDNMKFTPAGGEGEMAFKIVDPILGIYEIEGNRLRLCMNDRSGPVKKGEKPPDAVRPTAFDKEGVSLIFEKLK